jgi:signal transduction histidine kinase
VSGRLESRRFAALQRYGPAAGIAGAAISIGLIVTTVALTTASNKLGDMVSGGGAAALVDAGAFGLLGGLLVARRPDNPMGWLMLLVSLSQGGIGLADGYADLALSGHAGSLPGGDLAAWVGGWIWAPGFGVLLTVVVLIFPDGRPLTPRWRYAVWASVAAVTTVSVALAAGFWGRPGKVILQGNLTNTGPGSLYSLVFEVGILASGACMLAGIIAIVLRYRRGGIEERHQLKWVIAGTILLALTAVLSFDFVPLPAIVKWPTESLGAAGFPATIAIAILRYRLYDIDVVISRTLVYGSLAAFITAVYVGIVVGIGTLVGSGGRPNIVLSIVATAIVAVAFQPVRERLQKVANRLVYGKRATPYEVLSQFSERVAESYAADDVLPRMARVLADGTGAARADVWLRAGDMLRQAASWPLDSAAAEPARVVGDSLPEMLDTNRAVEVRHQGELLGALTVTKRKGESLTPVEEKLLADLAAQAGLVLKNVGLTAELMARLDDLRASRQRLVAAQDEERRRLERNLHDGAQQNLVALKVKLGLAEMFVDKDPARAKQTLAELKIDTDEALDTLRDLARGIYPPLLADKGLVAALQSQARKATLPVRVAADGVGRYPQEVEAAVYFCCLEALQNIQKYARASNARVQLWERDCALSFEVADDGKGFDAATASRGAGLTNMTDRLDALGGSIDLDSKPGLGTRLSGSLPIPVLEVVA